MATRVAPRPPARLMSPRLTGSLLALAAALVWGTAWVATGIGRLDVWPAAAAARRGFVSLGLFMLLLGIGALRTGSPAADSRPRGGRGLRYLVLALLGGQWFVLGMTVAVELTGATISAFVAGLY